jgi:hypothetical protein
MCFGSMLTRREAQNFLPDAFDLPALVVGQQQRQNFV